MSTKTKNQTIAEKQKRKIKIKNQHLTFDLLKGKK